MDGFQVICFESGCQENLEKVNLIFDKKHWKKNPQRLHFPRIQGIYSQNKLYESHAEL